MAPKVENAHQRAVITARPKRLRMPQPPTPKPARREEFPPPPRDENSKKH